MAWKSTPHGRFLPLVALLSGVAALAACSGISASSLRQPQQTATAAAASAGSSAAASGGSSAGGRAAAGGGGTITIRVVAPGTPPLPGPAALQPFPGTPAYAGEGAWQPAGRLVAGRPAVYVTLLVPPGGTKRAGIAWMDTSL